MHNSMYAHSRNVRFWEQSGHQLAPIQCLLFDPKRTLSEVAAQRTLRAGGVVGYCCRPDGAIYEATGLHPAYRQCRGVAARGTPQQGERMRHIAILKAQG